MEEDQEFKYFCKLCSRSFPCGRSLGGHMKSHLINNSDDQKFVKFSSDPQASYGLRENPKKTWRIADLSEDTSHSDAAAEHKLCRKCGKGFPSWKALVLHMKCHSNSVTNSSENEQDSCTSAKVVDSQSENETTNTTNTRRRRRTTSRKRRTRYMGTNTTTATATTSSSNFSIANNNASSSVTEIEQEQQEEVALCLMMLSRDVSHWGGLKFVADIDHSASDTNSEFSDDPSSFRTELIQGKLKKLDKKKKMIEEELSVGEFSKNDRFMNLVKKFNLAEAQFGSNNKFDASNNKSRKPQVGNDHNSPKRHKYECGTCNKVFKSYQALGGHRASHKKIKGCFASKIESSENTTEFDTDLSSDHQPSKLSSLIDHHQDVVVKAEKSIIGTKSKGHCCPICSRVFPTGQALGGHKRSHAIVDSRNGQSNLVIPKPPPTPEVRDYLDLNLPAPVEEESSTSHAATSQAFKPWWVGSSHKPANALVS